MKRILIVANRTLLEQHLLDEVRRRREVGPVQVHVLVPASHPNGRWSDGEVEGAARLRLADVLDLLAVAGIGATGEIGDASPAVAVEDVLRRGERLDEIIVSTLPAGLSAWMAASVVRRIAARTSVPVTHVVAEVAAPVARS